MTMARRNITAAIVLLAICAWYAWLAAGLPERHVPNTPGPSFFPYVIVSLVAVLALSLLINGLMGVRNARLEAVSDGIGTLGAVMLGVFLCYLAVLPVIGFVLASILFFAVLMVLYGSRRPVVIGLASVLIPLGLFVLFRYGFQIVLPRGAWGF